MGNFLEKWYKPIIIYIYILLLPITEVITTYMLRVMHLSITLGMVYKSLFLLYAIVYLLFVDKNNKKLNFIYLGIMAIFMIINVCVTVEMNLSIINKEIITYMSRYLCFPVILMFLYRYYKNGNKLDSKILIYYASIYAVIMLVAYLTNTQINIYGSMAHSGWFNSANELGAMLAITYPIILFNSFEDKKIINLCMLAVCTWAIVSLGSRVSFLILIITLIVFLLYNLIKSVIIITDKNISNQGKKTSWSFTIIALILVAGTIIYYPYSPFAKIWKNRLESMSTQTIRVFDGVENIMDTPEKQIEELIFNGRQLYLNKKVEIYNKSNFLEKMFGLTYKSQYIESSKNIVTVERDFHDIFFMYGIVGLILFIYPLLFIIIQFLRQNYKDNKILVENNRFPKVLSVCLALAVAYTGGHVLLMPAVCSILAIVIVSILENSESKIN